MVAIGIDFGYSSIRVAVFKESNGEEVANVVILENELGDRATPTVVAFDNERHERLVGVDAVHHSAINPDEAFYGIKRLVNRHREDIVFQQQLERSGIILDDDSDKIAFKITKMKQRWKRSKFTPTEMLAVILAKIKDYVENALEMVITFVVVSVPLYFTSFQRQAIVDAIDIIDIASVRLINDSTAVAVNFVWDKMQANDRKKLLVVDFGSSCIDVAVIDVTYKDMLNVEVKSTAGSSSLGGVDYDNVLIDFSLDRIKELFQLDISSNRRLLRKLRTQCEKAKITLQSKHEARIEIDTPVDGKYVKFKVLRDEFESLCYGLIEQAMVYVRKVFESEVKKCEIDEVIMVGGASRLKKFEESVNLFLGKRINRTLNVDEAVAIGCALYAANISGTKDEIISQLSISEITHYNIAISMAQIFNEDNRLEVPFTVLAGRHSPLPLINDDLMLVLRGKENEAVFRIFGFDSATLTRYEHFTTLRVLRIFANRKHAVIKVKIEVDENGIMRFAIFLVVDMTLRKLSVINKNECLTPSEINDMRGNIKKHKNLMLNEEKRISCKNEFEKRLFEIKKLVEEYKSYSWNDYSRIQYHIRSAEDWISMSGSASCNDFISKSDEIKTLIDEVTEKIDAAKKERKILIVEFEEMYAKTVEMHDSVTERGTFAYSRCGDKIALVNNFYEKHFECPNSEIRDVLGVLKNEVSWLESTLKREQENKSKAKESLSSYCSLLKKKPFDNKLHIDTMSNMYNVFTLDLEEKIHKAEMILNSRTATKQELENEKASLKSFIEKSKECLLTDEEERVKAQGKLKTYLGQFTTYIRNSKSDFGETSMKKAQMIIRSAEKWIEENKSEQSSKFEEKIELVDKECKGLLKEEEQRVEQMKELKSQLTNFWDSDENAKIQQRLKASDISKITANIKEITDWLNQNSKSSKSQFERKLKELAELNRSLQSDYEQRIEMERGVCVGIDFGSSMFGLSVIVDGECKEIKLEPETSRMASCVAFTPNGITLGNDAKEYILNDPKSVISDIKRLIGKKWDPRLNNCLPFDLECGDCWRIRIRLSSRTFGKCAYFVEEILALFLMHMKSVTKNTTGSEVCQITLTVPNSFGCTQRQTLYDAAVIAGFTNVSLVADTVAAAIGFVYDYNGKSHISSITKTLLVVSIGAAYTSVSVIRVENNIVECLHHSPGLTIGGRDFDARLRSHLFSSDSQTSKTYSTEFRTDCVCEDLKIRLSHSYEAEVSYVDETNTPRGIRVTRDIFETVCDDLFQKIFACINETLVEAKIPVSIINDVILCGGTTRIPKLWRFFIETFNYSTIYYGNDDLISNGAALFARNDSANMFTVRETSTFKYCVESFQLQQPMVTKDGCIRQVMFGELIALCDSDNLYLATLYECVGAVRTKVAELTLRANTNVKKGVVAIKLRLSIDNNGLIDFRTMDPGTQKVTKVMIKPQFSTEELEKLREDASKLLICMESEKMRVCAKRNLFENIKNITNFVKQYESISNDHRSCILSTLGVHINWIQCTERSQQEYEEKLKEIMSFIEKAIR